jgi:preprotein translocase subunit SecG
VIYLLYTIHVLLCLFLILVVLLQQGKGADLSVFGGGSTMTAFGARSATTLLHRLTVGAFVGFVLTTLSIAYLQANVEGGSVLSGAARTGVQQIPPDQPAGEPAAAAPAAPAPAAAAPPEAAPNAAEPTSPTTPPS